MLNEWWLFRLKIMRIILVNVFAYVDTMTNMWYTRTCADCEIDVMRVPSMIKFIQVWRSVAYDDALMTMFSLLREDIRNYFVINNRPGELAGCNQSDCLAKINNEPLSFPTNRCICNFSIDDRLRRIRSDMPCDVIYLLISAA